MEKLIKKTVGWQYTESLVNVVKELAKLQGVPIQVMAEKLMWAGIGAHVNREPIKGD